MKKWQKIVGVISFGLIGALLAYSISEIEIAYLWYDIICDANRGFWDAQPTLSHWNALLSVCISLRLLCLSVFGGKEASDETSTNC